MSESQGDATDQGTDPLSIVGTTVDKYEIHELIGEGGFSFVYRAEHPVWQQSVAIKFFVALKNAKPATRERLLEGFIREGQLMSELSSRSAAIVQARDIGRYQHEGGQWVPYMVLEWLDGTPLDHALGQERDAGLSPRSLAEAMDLLEPAAEAISLAHERGVAHRDLKPANLMVMGEARKPDVPVKVLDFGIAKVMGDQAELQEQLQQTDQKLTAFTPNYGAPEQFSRTFGATGPWTDVYAMALILEELMLGGQQVLQGTSIFEVGAMSCDAERRPTPLEMGLPVSEAVEAVFAQALALRPADRYPEMAGFWSELRTAGATGSTAAARERLEAARPSDSSTPGQPFDGTLARNPTVPSLATSIPELTPPRRSRPALALLAAAAGATLVGALLWVGLSGSPQPEPAALSSAAADEPPQDTTSTQDSAPAEAEPLDHDDAGAATSSPAEPSAKPSAVAPPPGPGSPPVRPRPATTQTSTQPAVPNAWDTNSFGGRR